MLGICSGSVVHGTEVVSVPLWISCQGHENDRVSVKMAIMMPRWSSSSLCWNPVGSSVGRCPCVLYNFILGNRQQATVLFKAGKNCLDHTPKKAFFVSSEQMQLCFKFPKIKSGDIVLSLHAKFYVPKCSLTSPELLL